MTTPVKFYVHTMKEGAAKRAPSRMKNGAGKNREEPHDADVHARNPIKPSAIRLVDFKTCFCIRCVRAPAVH
jgi:hypothetical protein